MLARVLAGDLWKSETRESKGLRRSITRVTQPELSFANGPGGVPFGPWTGVPPGSPANRLQSVSFPQTGRPR